MVIEDHYSKHLPNIEGNSQFKFLVKGNEEQGAFTYFKLDSNEDDIVWCKTAEYQKLIDNNIDPCSITSISYIPGMCTPTSEEFNICTGVDGYEVIVTFNNGNRNKGSN